MGRAVEDDGVVRPTGPRWAVVARGRLFERGGHSGGVLPIEGEDSIWKPEATGSAANAKAFMDVFMMFNHVGRDSVDAS